MIDSDKTEFAAILSGMAEVRGKPMSNAALKMYWLALADWSMADFRAAALHLLKTTQFMPTPYDFHQLRKVDSSGIDAWAKVRAIIRTRRPDDVTHIDPKTDRIVRAMGGYTQLGMTNTDDMHWREKRFLELWESLDDEPAELPDYSALLRNMALKRLQ